MRNIVVTGVGGGVGQGILKALADTTYGVVGVDSEELATGLYASPKAYKGCYASDPNFADRLLEICRKEECGLIFPGLDAELLPLSEHAERFHAEGIIPVVSSGKVIRTCGDKLATNMFLKQHGVPVPETCRLSEFSAFDRPVVLKPQLGGCRSQGVYLAHSPEEMAVYRQLVDPDNCIVQEYIEGDEYTCGSVTLKEKCAGVIVMRRILRNGDTYKAFVERNPRLESLVRAIAETLKPFGACNIQLRVRNGEPFVFEINARCSGTTAARALAGFNEPRMIADYLLTHSAPVYSLREISILRYWKELVVPNSRINQLTETRRLTGDGAKL